MARTPRSRREPDFYEGLFLVIHTVCGKNTNGTATAAELAVGRQANRLLLSYADLIESRMTQVVRPRDRMMLDRLRHQCGQYELRLWRSQREFSQS